jgi:hypothetical protein
MPDETESQGEIHFTEEKLIAFEDAVRSADLIGVRSFFFEEKEFLTAYAKYVVAYIKVQRQLGNLTVPVPPPTH